MESNINSFCKTIYLNDLFCIELRPLTHNSKGKGALCRNYTKDRSIWFKYPNVPERYGILLESNNLLIVDIDYPELINWKIFKQTFTVQTGNGGYHLYYSNPQKLISNHSPEWGEIKTSGHVVGPYVLHHTGNFYNIVNNFPIQPLYQDEFMKIMLQHSAAGARGGLLTQQQHLQNHKFTIDNEVYPSWQTTFGEMEWILKQKTGILFHKTTDRSSKDFLIALTLAEHGIDQNLIYIALKKWGTKKVIERGPTYVKHTVIAAVHTALQNKQSLFYKRQTGGDILPNIDEIKIFGKVTSGKNYCYKIAEKEMQKGNDTINFISLEKVDIMESDNGQIFYSKNPKKMISLPKDKEVLHTLGNILLSYPEPYNGHKQTEIEIKQAEKKKTK